MWIIHFNPVYGADAVPSTLPHRSVIMESSLARLYCLERVVLMHGDIAGEDAWYDDTNLLLVTTYTSQYGPDECNNWRIVKTSHPQGEDCCAKRGKGLHVPAEID